MAFLDFLTTLLLAPIELGYFLLGAAVVALLASGLVVAWFVAFFHSKYSADWLSLLTTKWRLHVSWAWGWIVVAALLLSNLIQLVYRDQVLSLLAGLPYLLAVPIALAIAAAHRHAVRVKVRRYQQMVQGRS